MMRLLLLLCLFAAEAFAAPRVMERGCDVASRRSKRGGVACGDAPFVLRNDFAFGTHARPTVESGAYLCRVNSGGTAWECVDSAGAAAGSLVQGTGATYGDTFAGSIKATTDITGAKAPVWTFPAGLVDGNFTVITAGYATTATDATYQHWVDCGNFYMRTEGNDLKARFGSGGLVATITNPARNVWHVVTARKSGTSHTTRVNGTTGTPNVFSDDLPTGCTAMHIGSSDGAALPLRGPMAWMYFVPRHLTDAEVLIIENGWRGLPSTTVATGSPGCIDNTAVSGQVDCFGTQGVAASTTKGIRGVRAFQNFWAADPLAAAGWTDVGTPVIVSNTASGPFSRMKQGAEVDSIEDNDAAALEGKQGATAGTTNGPYTVSCYVAAGTLSKVRLRLDTDGTGSTDCDFTDLSASYVRKACTGTVSGVATRINGQVLVGTAASDTGTILVSQCQLNADKWAESPTIDNAVVNSSDQYLTLGAIPTITSNGKFEEVFTPVHDPNADWITNADNIRVYDATPTAGGHYAYIIYGYVSAGDNQSLTSNGVLDAQINIAAGGVSLTAGQLYATSLEWRGNGATCVVILRLNSCSGTVAACTATTEIGRVTGQCPSQPDRVYLAERYSSQNQTSMFINAFRVYRP